MFLASRSKAPCSETHSPLCCCSATFLILDAKNNEPRNNGHSCTQKLCKLLYICQGGRLKKVWRLGRSLSEIALKKD